MAACGLTGQPIGFQSVVGVLAGFLTATFDSTLPSASKG
jgi:hypothetical protein